MMSEERKSNELNNNVIQEPYIVNTVVPVVDNDIETGNSKKKSDNEKVLKGILKNAPLKLILAM